MTRGKPGRYLALAEQIRRLVSERGLAEGARLPSEKALAREFGANHLTIRKALRVLAHEGLIHTIPSSGNYVGRQPVGRKRTGLIGVLFPAPDMFFFEIISELEQRLHTHGFHLIAHITHGSPDKEADVLGYFVEAGVEGILSAPNEACGAAYAGLALPTVFFDTLIPNLGIPYVVTDDFGGASSAVQHLAGLGHRRIAHIGGSDSTSEPRHAAYREVLARAGLPYSDTQVKRKSYDRQWGYYATAELLAGGNPPTALFCGSDTIAAGALRRLSAAGIACPGQVSVVGFANTPVGKDLDLTTVDQPCAAIAQAAWAALRNVMSGKRVALETRLATELIVRRTTAPPPRQPTGRMAHDDPGL